MSEKPAVDLRPRSMYFVGGAGLKDLGGGTCTQGSTTRFLTEKFVRKGGNNIP